MPLPNKIPRIGETAQQDVAIKKVAARMSTFVPIDAMTDWSNNECTFTVG